MQKLEKSAQAWAVTAWRLRDGEVVFRAADGEWVEDFGKAEVLLAKDGANAALAQAEEDVKARVVINAYLFEVAEEDGRRRSQIRARKDPCAQGQPCGSISASKRTRKIHVSLRRVR